MILCIIDAGLIFWFYKELTRVTLLDTKGLEQVANVGFRNNEVRRRLFTSIVWNSVKKKDPLFVNDSVLTLDNAEAIIKFNSGAEIELSPNSLIMLEVIKDTFSVNFIKGNIFTKTTGKKLKLRIKDQVVDLEDAKASISNKDISIIEGKAKIGDRELEKGDIGKLIDGKLAEVEKNIFQIVKPLPNQKILSRLKTKKQEFKWKKIKEIKTYDIEIAKDYSFSDIVFTKKNIKKHRIATKLNQGVYYFRLITKLLSHRKISPIQKFSIIFEEPTKIIYPINNKNYKYKVEAANIQFQWNASELENKFLLELASDKNFKNIIHKKEQTNKKVSIKLPAGEYFCRVKSFNPYQEVPLVSDVTKFDVTKIAHLSEPELLSPPKNKIYFAKLQKNPFLLFSWKAVIGAINYKLLISKDDDFDDDDIVQERVLKNTFVSISMLPEGKYYWSVQAVDELNEATKIVDKRFIHVDNNPLIKLLSPLTKEAILVKNTDIKLNFKWNNFGRGNDYKIVISEDRDFLNIRKNFEADDEQLEVSTLQNGRYFWRVEAYKGSRLVNISMPGEFNLKQYPFLSSINLSLPTNNFKIEYFKDLTLEFRWNNTKGATKYLFSLLSLKNKKSKLVEKKEIFGNSLTFAIPKIGSYKWSVVAIDKNGTPGKKGITRTFRVIPEKPIAIPQNFRIKIKATKTK